MGKLPYLYTDSEDTDTASSFENADKKKKKFSILKYSNGNVKKKKCKVHSRSEPEDSEFRSRSSQRVKYKLHGILKHDRDRESSDDEEDPEPLVPRSQDRCLVGRVPRPPGARPGRGGGVALVVRKNTGIKGFQSLQAQNSTSSAKRSRSLMKRLVRKRSY